MTRTIEELKAEVLSLSEEARADIADSVLASLAPPDELGPAWRSEIARRRREIADGTAELLDTEEVFTRARARLRK